MAGRPVTIRTFDLGADKDLNPNASAGDRVKTKPGPRAAAPSACPGRAAHVPSNCAPSCAPRSAVRSCSFRCWPTPTRSTRRWLAVEQAKSSCGEKVAFDENIEIGGMIEIPAAALAIGLFLRRLSFLSIGTNDLIQYTLAIDRTDEQVAALYDPLHPAVLMLIAHTRASAERWACLSGVRRNGRRPGNDPPVARHGPAHFSMHPAQILRVKQRVLETKSE